MAKQKLTLRGTTSKKVKVALNFSGVKAGKANVLGTDIITELEYKNIQQLVDFMQLLSVVTGDEQVDEPKAEASAPAETKKK